MCGIAGFATSPDERVNTRVLSQALLRGIEERGRQATGAAFFENGQAYVQKGPVAASTFVNDLDMSADAPTAVLHTRYATKGSREVNENNHPIEIPGHVIGVHNGCLWNDDDLFEEIGKDKRIAQVDSEAIFATLAYSGLSTGDALAKVKGSAAVAWIEPEGDPHTLHVARVSSSPLVYAYSEAGSFVFASTEHALRKAARVAQMDLVTSPRPLPEGTYLQVRHGEVIGKQVFRTQFRPATALSEVERRALGLAVQV